MTFFPEPITPSKGPQKREIRVNPAEADKKGKDSSLWGFPEKEWNVYYGSFLALLKRYLDPFSEGQIQAELYAEDVLSLDIRSLKALLAQAMEMDQSQSASFAQSISNVWNTLLHHLNLAELGKIATQTDLSKVKLILKEISNHPPHEEQKLGFYLAELSFKDWRPSPFMKIIRHLHDDYQTHKEKSLLQRWSNLLNESAGS